MTEKHYAHLAPNYVADTIRANFPNLGITETTNLVPFRGLKHLGRAESEEGNSVTASGQSMDPARRRANYVLRFRPKTPSPRFSSDGHLRQGGVR
jgi:hypothetical protein